MAPNPDYLPPVKDPREEGDKHWDTMRQELMLARDTIRNHEADIAAKDRRIDDLAADRKQLQALLEETRNELASLRSSLQNIGGIILTALAEAKKARTNGDAYKPKAMITPAQGDPVSPEDMHKLQNLLSANNTQQQNSEAEG